MSPTAERKEIAFTNPYYESQFVVIVKKMANTLMQKLERFS